MYDTFFFPSPNATIKFTVASIYSDCRNAALFGLLSHIFSGSNLTHFYVAIYVIYCLKPVINIKISSFFRILALIGSFTLVMAGNLAFLSDDVLSRILDFQSDLVIPLWTCGYTILNKRLSRCCRSFIVPSDVKTAYCWPRLLAHLPALTTVHFCVNTMIEPTNTVLLEVQKLPKSLTSLHVGYNGAWELFRYSASLPASFSSESSLPIENSSFKGSTAAPKLWNIGQFFPELVSLGVTLSAPSVLNSSELSVLPSSLQHLDFRCYMFVGDIFNLPRGLKTLRVQGWRPHPSPEQLSDLPRGLTELSGFEPKTMEQLAALPRGLKNVSWPKLFEAISVVELCTALPPTLTSLSCQTLLQGWYQFPRSLTSLTLSAQIDWSPERLASLPRSITSMGNFRSIHLQDLRSMSIEDAHKVWPPLRVLRFTAGMPQSLSHADILRLPPTLTSLQSVDLGRQESEGIFTHASDLPSSLTSLSVYVGFYTTVAAMMTELQEQEDTQREGDMVPLDRYPASNLPSSLKELEFLSRLDIGSVTIGELRAMPSGLTKLSINGSFAPAMFSHLPRGLLDLKLQYVLGSLTENSFDALPPALTALDIEFVPRTASVFPPAAFARLPSSLSILTVKGLVLMNNQIKHLPLHIRRLEAGIEWSPPFDLASLEEMDVRWLKWLLHQKHIHGSLKNAILNILYK